MPKSYMSVDERFEAKYRIAEDGCWMWTASRSSAGYAAFTGENSAIVRGHKWAYEREHGQLGDGLMLTHLCGVRHCVNPAHLAVITSAENVARATNHNSNTLGATPTEKIEQNIRATPFGCWQWMGRLTERGYGLVSIDGRDQYAHRVSYLAIEGNLTDGLVLDHLCSNKACVNPEHLEQVSTRVNVQRRAFPHRFVSAAHHQ